MAKSEAMIGSILNELFTVSYLPILCFIFSGLRIDRGYTDPANNFWIGFLWDRSCYELFGVHYG